MSLQARNKIVNFVKTNYLTFLFLENKGKISNNDIQDQGLLYFFFIRYTMFESTVKPPPNNDHLSTTTTPNPALSNLELNLPLNND